MEQNVPLINVTEELVRGIVRFLLHGPEYPTYCHCEVCEAKASAIALNHLESHYVATVEDRDRAFSYLKQPKQIAEINKQVIHAIHIIGQNTHKS
ncbi:late competence development ComFB family protein [Kurthia huakuii]|uniref:late competence development ComFB family protein n=1 Tax=Kurthia huakuii TaxID=1421019 RepID=UPI0004978BAF|nr:late competence development ComFB family protein [Kurthia huakuii]MBM7699996.1 competence protein ComFB [Kurthia huakuii]